MTLSLTDLRPGVAYVVDYSITPHYMDEPELLTLEARYLGLYEPTQAFIFKPVDGGETYYLFDHELVMLDYATDNQQPWPPEGTFTQAAIDTAVWRHMHACENAALFDGR